MNTAGATEGRFIDMKEKEKQENNPMFKLAAKTKGIFNCRRENRKITEDRYLRFKGNSRRAGVGF